MIWFYGGCYCVFIRDLLLQIAFNVDLPLILVNIETRNMLNSYLLSAVMLLFVVGCLILDLRLFISRVHWGLSEILSLNKILTTLRVILNSTRSITDKLHQLLKFFNRDQSKTWKINYFQQEKLLILNCFCVT